MAVASAGTPSVSSILPMRVSTVCPAVLVTSAKIDTALAARNDVIFTRLVEAPFVLSRINCDRNIGICSKASNRFTTGNQIGSERDVLARPETEISVSTIHANSAARMATETLFKSVPCLRWECLIFDREWTSENDA